jgi:CBS domain-containing protein
MYKLADPKRMTCSLVGHGSLFQENLMIPPREFIKKIKPFSFLLENELDVIVSALEVQLFNKGSLIYNRGDIPTYVYIIFSGLIGLFEDERPVDYLSRGELFAILCINGSPSRFSARAIDDSICYLIPSDIFRLVYNSNNRLAAFFVTLIDKHLECFKQIASDNKMLEEATFILNIDTILYKEPVTCQRNATIEEGASLMERNGVSSIVILDENQSPVGILTHKDLKSVIIRGDKSDSITDFMSSPVMSVTATETIFDAFTKMVEAGIDHLVVTREGKIFGVVTRKDIQIHLEPSLSIPKLFRRVARAVSIGELRTIFNSLQLMVARIVMSGPNFFDLTKMICTVHDAIIVKTIELTAGGSPTDRFVWVHMGSSGRREEIIATDQDSALIRESDDWVAFGDDISEALTEIGFPKCPGDYMVSNRMWNQKLSVWKDYFSLWFGNPAPEHVRYLSVFLDMRAICGDSALYNELLGSIRSAVTEEALTLLAQDAVQIEPPLGMWGIIGLHKGVDLKTYGLYPIVNGARVLAVECRMIEVTNTKERIEALHADGVISREMSSDLLEAYGFLQDLRLRHHSRTVLSQSPANNIVRGKELSKVDLLILKESLKIVASFQKFLSNKYGVERIVMYSQL